MRATWRIAIIGLIVTTAAWPLAAHHAFSAEFDTNLPVELHGTASKMEWVNPHAWLYIDVKEGNKVETWAIEMGAPNAMIRRGWNKSSIPLGIAVVVSGFQAKNGQKIANGRDVLLPDGRKLFIGTTGSGAPGEK